MFSKAVNNNLYLLTRVFNHIERGGRGRDRTLSYNVLSSTTHHQRDSNSQL